MGGPQGEEYFCVTLAVHLRVHTREVEGEKVYPVWRTEYLVDGVDE